MRVCVCVDQQFQALDIARSAYASFTFETLRATSNTTVRVPVDHTDIDKRTISPFLSALLGVIEG